jgi:hypothetical protein
VKIVEITIQNAVSNAGGIGLSPLFSPPFTENYM